MGILKQGEYLGLHKEGENYLHKFRPMVIAFNGTVEYVRIGKPNTKFADDRDYVTDTLNIQEEELVDKYNGTI
jgi:hypothetical protein